MFSSIKTFIPTLLFYCLSVVIIYLLDKVSPSGPCNPGTGILCLLLFVAIAIFLLLRNIFLALATRKEKPLYIAALHVLLLLSAWLIF